MTRSEIIETMARAICCPDVECSQERPRDGYITAIPCCRIVHMSAATAALSALEAAGLAVVPVEPTRTACEAIVEAAEIYDEYGFDKCVSNPDAVYEAMIAAAQGAHKP